MNAMPLDPQRWTEKTKESFSAATRMAAAANNPEVTPAHLLSAILADPDTIARPVIAKVGASPDEIAGRLAEALSRLPSAVGGGEPTLGRAAREGLETADSLRAAPEHGQHTEEILLELGLDWDAIIAYKEAGAIL